MDKKSVVPLTEAEIKKDHELAWKHAEEVEG